MSEGRTDLLCKCTLTHNDPPKPDEGDWTILLCPLHASAPDLLAVLVEQGHEPHEVIGAWPDEQEHPDMVQECHRCDADWPCPAAQAIAQATGEKE